MNNLMNDLSALTSINKLTMEKLIKLSRGCICHSVIENLLQKNPDTDIDIGIGVLHIRCEEDQVKYKFIPAKNLEENVAAAIQTKVSPITLEVEDALKDRVESAYKHLLL